MLAAIQVAYARGLRDGEDGDRRENLERALSALQEAISGYDRLGNDDGLASALHELGIVYKNRIAGNKAQNIEWSIACHSRELPLAKAPEDRGMAAYSLAQRYRARLEGNPTCGGLVAAPRSVSCR